MEKSVSDNLYDISVIVPFYNVREYLRDCLDSLLRQKNVSLQVIIVDDGATDGSDKIADEYAAQYAGFACYHKSNEGPGSARNYGVRFAKGKYIAFADSDDIVADGIYEMMFLRAEKDKSDITICNVSKFVNDINKDRSVSSLHMKVFRSFREITHITEDFDLLWDTTCWNKLILRSFYEENAFHFPEGIVYEDIPFNVSMHLAANQVSLLYNVGYYWRVRDSKLKSITQNKCEFTNFLDRLTALKMTDAIIKSRNLPHEFKLAMQLKMLKTDLPVYIGMCNEVPDNYLRAVLLEINRFVDEQISQEALDSLDPCLKQVYVYIQNMDLGALRIVWSYYKTDYQKAPVIERNGKLFFELPDKLFTIPDRDAFNNLATRRVHCNAKSFVMDDKSIEITVEIFRSRIRIRPGQQDINASLYNNVNGRTIPLKVEHIMADYTYDRYDSGFDVKYDHDGTAVKLRLDYRDIENPLESDSDYMFLISSDNRFFSDSFIMVTDDEEPIQEQLLKKKLLCGNFVCLDISPINQLMLRTYGKKSQIDLFDINGYELNVITDRRHNALTAVSSDTVCYDSKPFMQISSDSHTIDLRQLKTGCKYSVYSGDTKDISMKDGRERCMFYFGKKVVLKYVGQALVVAGTLKPGLLSIQKHENISVVSYSRKEEQNILLGIRNDFMADRNIKNILLCTEDIINKRDVVMAEAIPEPLGETGVQCSFRIDFNKGDFTRNLYTGKRAIFVVFQTVSGDSIRHSIYSELPFIKEIELADRVVQLFRDKNCSLHMKIRQIWPDGQKTPEDRHALIKQKYPEYRNLPLNEKLIVFESYRGDTYSCNPRALYEYIDKNYPEYECVWILSDPGKPVPGNAKRVRRLTLESYYYLATAKYLVNNVNFQNAYIKREGQIEIQTMRGTPLKTIGLQVPAAFADQKSIDGFVTRNARWNYLVVQGPFMEQKAFDIFRYKGEILRTGYPRTDVLYNQTEEYNSDLKKRLGIPEDKKIILYIPTWRVSDRFDLNLDIDYLRDKLADEYVLLIRLHNRAKKCDFSEDGSFIFDLTEYGSVEDLYLIADIMVTDYSSAMFDFALLEKPMVFYAYDLDDYYGEARGLYVDYESEVPGPVVRTDSELVDSIRNVKEDVVRFKEKADSFRKKYLAFECGNSCEKIIRAVLDPESKKDNADDNRSFFSKIIKHK